MELYRMIKRDSRSVLKTCWGRSVSASLIIFAVYLMVSLSESVFLYIFSDEEFPSFSLFDAYNISMPAMVITFAAAVVSALVFPGLAVGYKRLHLKFITDGKTPVSVLFDAFSSFRFLLRSIALSAMLIFRVLFFTVLSLIPGGTLIYVARTYIEPGTKNTSILQICAYCVGGIVTLLCLSLFIIYAQRWFTAIYYLAEGKSPGEAIKLSVKATKGYNIGIIRFKLTFIGWALLSILFFPMLWALPYYSTSKALYAKYLMERYERSLAAFPENEE